MKEKSWEGRLRQREMAVKCAPAFVHVSSVGVRTCKDLVEREKGT